MRRTVLLAVALSLLVVTGARAWTWPATVPCCDRSSSTQPRPIRPGQHRGILVGGSSGESVLAPAAGTVSFAGSVPGQRSTLTIRTAGWLCGDARSPGVDRRHPRCDGLREPGRRHGRGLERRARSPPRHSRCVVAPGLRRSAGLPAARPVPPVEPLLTPSPAAEAPAAEPPTEAAPDGSPQVPYDGAPRLGTRRRDFDAAG